MMKKNIYKWFLSITLLPTFVEAALNITKDSVIISGMRQRNIEVSYGIVNGYKSPVYGFPYMIRVKNNSNKSIELGPQFLGKPIVSYDEIIRSSNIIAQSLGGILAVCVGGIGTVLSTIPKKRLNKIYIGTATAGAALGAYKLILKLANSAQIFWKEAMLQGPVIIASGEEVEKLFWLENNKDGVMFNFDIIKILE